MDPFSLVASSLIAQQGFGNPTPMFDGSLGARGEFFQGSQPIDEITLERIIYRGDCPGEEVSKVRNMSFLAPIPPAGKQRIVVRNRRTGGFTNREYGSGRRRSERFNISLGSRQHGSFLSVSPGENEFRWKVTSAGDVDGPKEGNAVLMVMTEDRVRYRDFRSINEDAYCPGEKYSSSRTPLGQCSTGYYKVSREGVCPDGQTIQLGTQQIYRRHRFW